MLQSKQTIPKVYLSLTRDSHNHYKVQAVHRPTAYAQNLVAVSDWDDRNFAFIGDLRPGNYIKTVEFPDTAFELTGAQRVPTIENTTALFAAEPGL